MASLWTIDTSYGKLTINSLNLHTAAWLVLDVRPLFVPQKRGGNVKIPGKSGARAYRLRIDEARHSLPMWITGQYTSTGGLNSNRFSGFHTNLQALRTSLLAESTAATLTATITSVPGTTKTYSASVQVLDIELDPFDPDQQKQKHKALLHLVIPTTAGRFTT